MVPLAAAGVVVLMGMISGEPLAESGGEVERWSDVDGRVAILNGATKVQRIAQNRG